MSEVRPTPANDQFSGLSDQWAAGFFEGEGHARLHKGPLPKWDRLFITIAQVKPEPLDAFAAVMGAGKVRGPYGPYSGNRQPHFQYTVMGPPAIEVARRLLPYLFGKKEQLQTALDLYLGVLHDRAA